jgi:hypothetical protein
MYEVPAAASTAADTLFRKNATPPKRGTDLLSSPLPRFSLWGDKQ